MKASELIEKLSRIINEHGDRQVRFVQSSVNILHEDTYIDSVVYDGDYEEIELGNENI